jgi:hypothetical protein
MVSQCAPFENQLKNLVTLENYVKVCTNVKYCDCKYTIQIYMFKKYLINWRLCDMLFLKLGRTCRVSMRNPRYRTIIYLLMYKLNRMSARQLLNNYMKL